MSTTADEFYSFDYLPTRTADGHYPSITGYNFTELYFSEPFFFNKDYVRQKLAFIGHLSSYTVHISLAYVLIIFALKRVMQSREKLSLRYLLIAWNICLAAFSIVGTMRVWPEFVYTLRTLGFDYTVCNSDSFYGVAGFWSYLFTLSKLAELFDTFFIVMRKQKLIFLHYYHHASILVFCFSAYSEAASTGRWFGAMNYLIHSLMYTYYALRAMRVTMPKKFSLFITSLQIALMIFGIFISFYVLYRKQFDTSTSQCSTHYHNIKYSLLMYLSYFLLFLNFLLQSYIFQNNNKNKTSTKSD